MKRESKSQDVQPISLINPHKFDLNKPYYDEEELHPKEELLQKENKSENLQSINKTISSTSRNFDLNKPYYDEEDLYPPDPLKKMMQLLLPNYSKVWVIF
ncbi:unnamed protein product [Arabidopsis lyrata]|uniref:Predicted protein n=1 Tax=Arabidopsis lyrata subsp. lyrata TaxID=81972 RepID=D7MHA5_ARALL|nr:predicted protein [Arabidopsis lyrata subsp. lyrata]CAH8276793.1 unnamed protein product [Arabidopsis lyrata]